MAGQPNMTSSKEMMKNKNVAGGQLAMLTKDYPVGYYKDGYCRTGPEDKGNHSVGAIVNKEFLDFTNSRGNNLEKAGVKDGMKWCLCASRWKEAFDAAQKGDLAHSAVPKVQMHASHEKALDVVSYKDIKKYSASGEVPGGQSRNRQPDYASPEKPGGPVKESSDISGNSETTGGSGVRTDPDKNKPSYS
ncbi:hypothetical protein LTR10_022758 [Elasticomyces elasticus]|uniref:Uncharacterized protein n=1 Tax=Exophiala sideris TaxID=1016849 RepID=A0ABR0JP30_9EURO|nr:hypothetical protein LTR10_022758 [Elasticomyces elasticus]KAK5037989.1 hypothetical protein LTS07_001456 [Exophiala sideris]KAK5043971.1 hypothetical protein LTR13_000326 [Exophiala sideris]KAK5067470.1 hypothetical protein LTR69_001458 [Exophiala sideris]KAK5184294.1 hypothetical protein LTR44_003801 [Eurotiomycetes sp. CCFEE 6388]